MSYVSLYNAEQQISYRNAAHADPIVHMYEDGLPIIGEPSIYFSTCTSDNGTSLYQPWHYYLYRQLKEELGWTHSIFIPEQRKPGGNRKSLYSAWRRRAQRQAEHLVFYFPKEISKKEETQLYLQIGLALGRNEYVAQQEIWVASKIGDSFCRGTKEALQESGFSVYGNLSQIEKQLQAYV